MEDVFAPDRCHIISSDSGSGWLKHAAKLKGDAPKLIMAFHRLIYAAGPIAGITNPTLYGKWCDQFAPGLRSFSGLDHAGYLRDFEQSWNKFLRWTGPISFWFSRTNIQEASFFLGFLQSYPRLENVDFIDVSCLTTVDRKVTSTGECTPELLDAAWLEKYRMSTSDVNEAFERYAGPFSNANGIRAFSGGQIISAPIEHHDAAILQGLDKDWVPLADVFRKLYDADNSREFRHLEYFYILWRVKVLAECGKLECVGDFEEGDLTNAKVRIP